MDEFLDADAIMSPAPFDRMLALGGVAFENGAAAAKAYPQLWRKAATAKKAIQRERVSRETLPKEEYVLRCCPSATCIVFRQAGASHHDEHAWFDPARVGDPRAAIEAIVGPLAKFELVDPKAEALPKLPPCRRRLGKGRARRAAVTRGRRPVGVKSGKAIPERRSLRARSARLALSRSHK